MAIELAVITLLALVRSADTQAALAQVDILAILIALSRGADLEIRSFFFAIVLQGTRAHSAKTQLCVQRPRTEVAV